MSDAPVYLDNNATTQPAREVIDAATEAMNAHWFNPSSVHRGGQAARQQVELARRSIAMLIGASPREVTFTASATESIALAVLGTVRAFAGQRRRIVTTAVEHEAVRGACETAVRDSGAEVIEVAVGRDGLVDPAALEDAMDESVALVTMHGVNNETGAIQPIDTVGRICREYGTPFHCDATQWIGKLPFEVQRRSSGGLPVDLVSFSAHKFHGPKGVGVLWAGRGTRLSPMIPGTQERGRRGGTENTIGVMGMGVAAELAAAWLSNHSGRARGEVLRDRLVRGICERVPGAVVHGPSDATHRIWNTASIGFPRLEAEAILMLLSERGVYASAGAACSSGSLDPSPVLLAMGIPPEVAHGTVRFSLSRETTEAEVDRAVEIVAEVVERLGRGMPG